MSKNLKLKTKKVLLATGGTGGHLFPAEGLAEQLCREASSSQECEFDILFAGMGLDSNRFFSHSLFKKVAISSATFSFRNPIRFFVGLKRIIIGFLQSCKLLRSFNPDAVIGFGSYHVFPILLAAKVLRFPIILHEANSTPGRVNRFFADSAAFTGVYFPGAASLLKGRVLETDMPLRKGYCLTLGCKEKARELLSLKSDCFTLLVFGGSQGAQTINQVVEKLIDTYLKGKEIQVIHFTGNEDVTEKLVKIYKENGICAYVKTFDLRMDVAMQAADLLVSRAGASSIAEQVEMELPGILIPYPYAKDQHQEKNAEFMSGKVSGAVKIKEESFNCERLINELDSFLGNKQEKLNRMQQAIKEYKKKVTYKGFYFLVNEWLSKSKEVN